jgi:SM-20-related protein
MILAKDGIIDRENLQICNAWLDKANWSYGWHSNKNIPFGHWNVDITKSPVGNTTDLTSRLPKEFKAVWNDINKEFFKDKAVLVRCYSNKQTFGTEGFIHTDTKREQDQTVIVYMNEEWEADWGGETTFYNHDKSEITDAILPKFGRVVVFPGNIHHCARAVTRICPKARTTLMYKVSIDPQATYPAEQMLINFIKKIGADKRPHKTGNLGDHLLRTFYILKAVNAPDYLALAGGLHSVYSTNRYKTPVIPWESTQIEELFGKEVDRIVRLFAKLNKPAILENPDGSISDQDLVLFRYIECANLYDQGTLDPRRLPNLCAFAEQIKKEITNGR